MSLINLLIYLVAISFVIHQIQVAYSYYCFKRSLKNFKKIKERNCFVETREKLSLPNLKKEKVGVLMYHGFACASNQFDPLIQELKKEKIAYQAITLPDHGLADCHLYRNIRVSDWKREALRAYDAFSKSVEKVIVLGSSNGACLATYVAQNRPVEKALLSAPAIEDRSALRKILPIPVLSHILFYLLPIMTRKMAKKMNKATPDYSRLSKEYLKELFIYPSYSFYGYRAVNQMQASIDLTKLQTERVELYFADCDRMVDNEKALALFKKSPIKELTHKTYEATHLILYAKKRDLVIKDIIQSIKEVK